MIELTRFRTEHWLALTGDLSSRSVLQGRVREEAGIAYSAIDGDLILGCAGIIAERRYGTLWALLSDELKRKHPLWFHRQARGLLMPVIRTLDLTRVEALVDPEIQMNCRWLEALGFTNKRIKERAGADGGDVWEYCYLPERTLGEA